MKSIHKITAITLSLLLTINFVHAKSHSEKSIVTTAQEAGVFSTLITAAQAAGLVEWIEDAAPKTLFAPTDEAFAKLPAGTVESLLQPENQAQLIRILQYHFVLGEVMSTQLTNGIVSTALSAGLKVSTSNGVVLNDSVMVTSADIEAKNGIIHIIDNVLLPPSDNIVDAIVGDPELSTLTAALTAAGLVDEVRTGGPFTIFAPTDAAFAALPEGTLDTLLDPANLSTLQNILLYHISGQNIYSGNLMNGPISALNGGTINVNLSGPVFQFPGGGSNPVAVDILGTNGVIHKIDTVLLPGSDNIVDILAADGRFTTLLTAATQADLGATLSTIGGATLFAPTDEAFGKLPADLVQSLLMDENMELLKNVLLYHVVPQNTYANNISTRVYETATTVGLGVKVHDAGVMVGTRSMVTGTDMIASNGVIHTIDEVILPPLNMADTLESWGNYTILTAALKAAGLFDTLNSAGPFTLFAPTDEAFAKLPEGTVENLLLPENLETLQSILLAHVVSGKVYGGELLKMQQTTLQGKMLNVHLNHNDLMIGSEASILISDRPVWNGVIHTIDTVLLP